MSGRRTQISDNDDPDYIRIEVRHRGHAYYLRIRIGINPSGRKSLRKTRTCSMCGAMMRNGRIARCTIEYVHCEIENDNGLVITRASSHFGKILINKARRLGRLWLCQDIDGCELKRFECA